MYLELKLQNLITFGEFFFLMNSLLLCSLIINVMLYVIKLSNVKEITGILKIISSYRYIFSVMILSVTITLYFSDIF
jgi:hypothetical protein